MKKLMKMAKNLKRAVLDPDGGEILNPTPLTFSPGVKPPETMDQKISRIVQHALRDKDPDEVPESFEDSQDFDIEDEDEIPIESLYQMLASAQIRSEDDSPPDLDHTALNEEQQLPDTDTVEPSTTGPEFETDPPSTNAVDS